MILRRVVLSSVCLVILASSAGVVPSAAAAQSGDLFIGSERAQVAREVDRLAAIQARNEAELFAKRGVHGVGIGVDPTSRELVFVVAVDSAGLAPDLPLEIEGVPVVVDRSEPPVAMHGGSSCMPCHANQQSLPVQMGNSTFSPAFCASCTLGFKACYRATGQTVYVTNAHCSTNASGCEGTAPIGSDTVHRAPGDAFCAFTTDIGDVSGHRTPSCSVTNRVDGARIVSSNSLTSSSIRDIGTHSTINGTVLPGDLAQKSGRTTGFTVGIVNSVNYSTTVGGYCCGGAPFTNQIRVNADVLPFIQPGDSGSALLNFQSPPRIVGLLFAGPPNGAYGVANKLADVLGQLNLHLDTRCPPTACFSVNPSTGQAPLTVSLNASCSSDPGGGIVSYQWNLGDGRVASGQSVNVTYYDPDVYQITLTVTDNQGATGVASQAILVSGPGGCIICP